MSEYLSIFQDLLESLGESERTKIFYRNSFVSLLSTGLDSPIATYLFLRKGYSANLLSFLNGYEEADKNKRKIENVCEHLVFLTGVPVRCHFINYDPILEHIQEALSEKDDIKQLCLFCKRTMIDLASLLSKHYGSGFIVTGEILGEQASQTLDNLLVINEINREIPVIRPLIGFDKLDIIKISQKLGFYEKSLIEGVSCNFNPRYPETHARLNRILRLEKRLDRNSIRREILSNIEIKEIFP